MGTSGNRPGYKIFSFNTSVRNPKRNEDFLKAFIRFDGQVFDKYASHAYLCELVKLGVYKFVNVSEDIKYKWDNNIDLTRAEVESLIAANPQATGEHNRVMTSYMGSLKNQGFLAYYDNPEGGRYHIIKITKLGKMLIDPNMDESIVYTKAMIGLHALSPSRTAMYNRSRPFLNTLFVVNRVNQLWEQLGNEPKGILRHEFSTFVLSMRDCDYERAAQEIIKYRKKFRYEVKITYIKEYLQSLDIEPYEEGSITKDYPDDVFRKFEMTGLMRSHGAYSYIYYDLSKYNEEKVKQILDFYKDYSFNEFENQERYLDFMTNVIIPWEENVILRRKIAQTKAAFLGRPFNDSIPLEEEELQLDRAFYSGALKRAVDRYDLKFIFKELMILSGVLRIKSKFFEIPESLRLEYLLALALGKIYGTNGLVSNIIYNEDGDPMHVALGGQCDIILYREEGSLILEPTMITGRDQQRRNETTSITRHATTVSGAYASDFRTIMIAPKVHPDSIDYFTYRSTRNHLKLLTLTIAKTVGLFNENRVYSNLLNSIDDLVKYFCDNQDDFGRCADFINSYRPDASCYE